MDHSVDQSERSRAAEVEGYAGRLGTASGCMTNPSHRGAMLPGMSPLELLSASLADQRRLNRPFDAAWPVAVRQALDATGDPEWVPALDETRHAWEAAYDRRPAARRERAALALLPDPDAEILDGDARLCDRCGDPIPPETRSVARFCSRACQRAAHGRVATAA